MTPRHVIVIGAARSGTKLLRDSLAVATGAGKVPYDVGYVWRTGNESSPDDALTPDLVDARKRRFISQFIDGYASGEPPAVIEKTVGNALRVPLVAHVFPDARFVHLVRDGVDVSESALRQWTAPTDLRYLAAKARTFPLRLVPRYGLKYARSLAGRRRRADKRVGSWGPRYPGIDADLRTTSLLTVSARQWRAAVEQARLDLGRLGLPAAEIRYERLVEDPQGELARVAEFAGLSATSGGLVAATRWIDEGAVGKGRADLSASQLQELDVEVGDLLDELGYDRPMPDKLRDERE